MTQAVTVRAPAKINLYLGVGPVREDGFHPLATVYQAIGLYDDVTVTPAEQWEIHTVADAGIDLAAVPDDEDNIAIRAGKALVAHHHRPELAAHVEIHKGIPVAGGMGGGSADAAATLVAVDRLFDLNTSDDDLLAIAAELGSDVPFALIGGTAIGTGRGEIVEPVVDTTQCWWVVVPHEIGLSTPLVYKHFDMMVAEELLEAFQPAIPQSLLGDLATGDVLTLTPDLENDLAAAAYDLRPDLVELRERLERLWPDAVLLSGSGPTQLALFADRDAARIAAGTLSQEGLTHWLAPGPVAGCTVIDYS
ncbi:4-(cytidine 5'-diphospho)-2-C-methyl-D-erythritol kinase [Nocardioides sp. Kera G14]|uniref:4-(cytidine 5'-diphospho)-2-C-methyl-D-erythritol kinase n=1 Tax=Nocardioides sp. Kera G14 TaxID=2884264 RepID=UPI001D121EE3|nr:4-(cytidine 5'-diphospho)-2-C-methyl-D-erythritol kinase [Nocardioides sp. Kera G14]UDY24129.1 4-(cytidine 5'-diphospho)-2-C-methyl-D-erythritol kinase [Nocardioides sp. Kera G14]